jgi:hypothetical protein
LFHGSPPPRRNLPILQHLITAYKLWYDFLPHIPKDARYTLGTKVDASLVDAVEAIFVATFLAKEKKLPYVQRAAAKLDLVKFFLQVTWDIKALDNKKYALISEQLAEVGRMLGGWIRQLESRN